MTKTIIPFLILIISWLTFSACDRQLTTSTNQVPLPNAHSIVWNFMNLIKEGNIPEAVKMLQGSDQFDDQIRQDWATQFNNWGVDTITGVTAEGSKFRVDWTGSHGSSTKWISVNKSDGGLWQISEIATGP